MALKDLIADKEMLDEAAIERIVIEYVRYDIEAKAIIPTPSFAALSNRAKILVYLVAMQGWKFVIDDPVPSDARPTDLESAIGIPGGSLRPVLRELSDAHILVEKNSRYSVRATAFTAIQAELTGDQTAAPAPRRSRPPRRPIRNERRARMEPGEEGEESGGDADTGADESAELAGKSSGKRTRKIVGKTTNLAGSFNRLVSDGFFNTPRTATDVREHFRKNALIVRSTSLPKYFIKAVQDQRLTREEVEQKGKKVWAYTTHSVAT